MIGYSDDHFLFTAGVMTLFCLLGLALPWFFDWRMALAVEGGTALFTLLAWAIGKLYRKMGWL